MTEGMLFQRLRKIEEAENKPSTRHSDEYEILTSEKVRQWLEEAMAEFQEINPHPEFQAQALRRVIEDFQMPSEKCLNSGARTILWFVRWFVSE